MKFEEAKNLELISSEFISIKQAKERGIIPSIYHTNIPDTCIGCGSDLVTNLNLTRITCVDPNCIYKRAGRAIKVLNNFGIKGIGRAFCSDYFEKNPEYTSHLAILYGKRVNYYRTDRIADSDGLIQNLYNIRVTPITYADLVSRLALPNLSSRAKSIFKGYNSFLEFEECAINTIGNIRDFLLQFEGIDYILAETLARTFKIFRQDLINISNYFIIRPACYMTVNICLTGDMDYKNMTKKEYETYLNILGDGFIEVINSSAKMSADFIISKYANEYVKDSNGEVILDAFGNPTIVDYTAKHNVGKSRNISEGRKVLLSPEDMVNVILKYVESVKKRKVLIK